MAPRRWPDLVIVVAVLGLAALGAWALWGEDLGLRAKRAPGQAPAPTGTAPGPGSGA